jgi:predicted MFS family arabinose efflux permease
LWTVHFALLLATTSLGLSTLNLSLPVLPIAVERLTGQARAAGVVTAAVSLFSVVFELAATRLVERFRPAALMITALVVEGIAMVGLAEARSLPEMLLLGALMGAGFGTVATVTATLIGALAPASRRGEAIGYFGLAASFPSVIAPSAALILLNAFGLRAVFLCGAVTCSLAIAASSRLRTRARPHSHSAQDGQPGSLRNRHLIMIWASLLCVTITYGGVISFTPFVLPASGAGSAPLFLFLFGLSRSTARAGSGRIMDRVGDRRLVVPSLAVGVVGLVLLATNSGPAVTIAAAVLYGTAFGISQTGCFVGMLRATQGSRPNVVSGFWNVAMDAGVGSGALVLAPVGAAVGFAHMLWLLPGLLVLSIAIRLAELRA